MSLYSYDQERVLFWAGKPSTLIGILGSAYVCACIRNNCPSRRGATANDPAQGGGRGSRIAGNKSCMRGTFFRFVFFVSMGHIFLCLAMAMSSIPTPKGSFYASMGNEQTCSAMGFISHFIFGFTLFYHGAIGCYYILTFFWGWTPRQFEARIEPLLHCIAVLGPLTGAIVGVSTNMYHANPILMNCWVAPAPFGCQYSDPTGETCTEGGYHHRELFVWLAGLIELNYYTFAKQAALVTIAVTVYRQERKMNARYSMRSSLDASTKTTTSTTAATTTTTTASNSTNHATTITRETLIQSSLYFFSCSIPYMPMMVMRFLDLYWKNVPADLKVPTSLYVFAVFAQILYPLQGPITVVAYTRPCMLKRWRENPEESWWNCFFACCKIQLGCSFINGSAGAGQVVKSTTRSAADSSSTSAMTSSKAMHQATIGKEEEDPTTKKKIVARAGTLPVDDHLSTVSFFDEEKPDAKDVAHTVQA